ncbi:TPA: hypothetical protein ACRM4Q_001563 [Pseudomonas aeruginosa]
MKPMIQAHLVERDQFGFWTHPNYPDLADNCSSNEAQETLRRLGLELQTVFMESDAPRLYDSARSDQRYSEWIPTRPEGSGWFVLSIHDTENGPVCQYVRPLAESLSPIDLDAAAEQHERLLSEACAKALNQRDVAQDRVAELEMLLRKLSTNGLMQFSTVDEEMAVQAALGGAPVAQAGQVPQAWLDVQAERRRQITVEGFDTSNDDGSAGQIALAAGCYALHAGGIGTDWPGGIRNGSALFWPWDEVWWKPKSARENLVRAGALVLAEIERLDRFATEQGSTCCKGGA